MKNHLQKLTFPLFLLVLLAVWASFFMVPTPARQGVSADTGVLSLVDMRFSDIVYRVEGGWESYPEHLYEPADFAFGVVAEQPQTLTTEDYQQIQYATHRLRAALPPGMYSVSLKSCDYSMRIYINGEEAGSVGTPGTTRETTVPRVEEKTYSFYTDTGTVEFLVQCANFVHKEGCQPPYNFTLGTPESITRLAMVAGFQSALFIGCLLTAGLSHLAMFFFNRQRVASLMFFICCVLMIFMANRLIPLFFPNYNWFVAFRIEYIVLYLTLGSLVLLVDVMFPTLLHRFITWPYYGICLLYTALTLILDSRIYTNLLIYFHIATVFMIFYVLIRLGMGLRHGKEPNLLAFIGMLAVCLFGLYDILRTNNIIDFGYIAGQFQTVPIGMVVFVFCYSLAVSMEFAQAEQDAQAAGEKVREAEEHYHALLKQHRAQTPAVSLGTFGLTKREADVAWLLVDGKQRKEIAELLHISAGTVNTHCSHIYEKTGCAGLPDLLRLLGMPNWEPNGKKEEK